jgi:hypothetical protein
MKTEEPTCNVIGIALVVEERGKGSRLVFRYPNIPEDCDCNSLFFTLPSRAMAKIFRPKKPLCNQPMTITLGRTVFCCRAVLMSPDHIKDPSAIVLFSIVVAAATSTVMSSIPLSGWFDIESEEKIHTDEQKKETQNSPDTSPGDNLEVNNCVFGTSATFLAVQKIHISLARLCRVLQREELRCRYVAIQSMRLHEIVEAYKNLQSQTSTAVNSSTSEIGPLRHRRTVTSGTVGSAALVTEEAIDREDSATELRKRQERDQEVLELMLAATIDGPQIYGNIIRELLQAYHIISQIKLFSTPIASAILTARDRTVFINRHIAVPLESVAVDSLTDRPRKVLPYHTLLFPRVSAAELSDSLISYNSRMKHFLSYVSPLKTMADLSRETAVPLSSILDIANYLTTNRLCFASHVIKKKSILASCEGSIERMHDQALQFSQVFYHLSIHIIVSMLTRGNSIEELAEKLVSEDSHDSNTLGFALFQIVTRVRSSRDEESRKNRTNIQDLTLQHTEKSTSRGFFGNTQGLEGGITSIQEDSDDERGNASTITMVSLEDFLMNMAVWLCARHILVPMQQYLVYFEQGVECKTPRIENDDSFAMDTHRILLDMLLKEGYLNGRISTVAMCWRFSIHKRDLLRLQSWGHETGCLISVWRIPRNGDDYEKQKS